MRLVRRSVSAALVWCSMLGVVHAADGIAVGVDPAAVARTEAVERVLITGAEISVGERIVTGPAGEVQIVFSDETRLVVGRNSSLLIEQYLLRGDETASTVAVNALAGTFRFVTGNSDHDAYEISTPTGTIGVRGTAFDFFVTDEASYVVLFEGSVRLCAPDGGCETLAEQCTVGGTEGGSAALIGPDDPRLADLSASFPYVQSQIGLKQGFRIAGARECLPPLPIQSSASSSDVKAGSGNSDTRPPYNDDDGGDGGEPSCPPDCR